MFVVRHFCSHGQLTIYIYIGPKLNAIIHFLIALKKRKIKDTNDKIGDWQVDKT